MTVIDSIRERNKQVVLLILDGWGLSPCWGGNAISMSAPENFNTLWRDYPHQVLQALGKIADPKTGKVSSSEVGHASIGTGRMVLQDLTEINTAITDKSFFQNLTLLEACNKAKDNNSSLHLIGLVSDGGVHSHIDHLFALLEMAKINKVEKVYIHVITDGYDTEPNSALGFIHQLEEKIKVLGTGEIATIIGRYWAMDRDNNWDRIKKAYELQVISRGHYSVSARNAVSEAYKLGFSDVNIPATVILRDNQPVAKIAKNDSVIFFNFRADRARELARAYTDKNCFKQLFFRQYKLLPLYFATLTSYRLEDLPIHIVFAPAQIETSLAKILSDHSMRQLHLAESEKYAHVTYFFNGGNEEPFPQEDRIFIPSLKINSYAQKPEMALGKLTSELINQINSGKYNFIVANIPNVDMVSHTGDILATQQAASAVDKALGKIYQTIMKKAAILMVTSDHGNAEQMTALSRKFNDKVHNLNPVPFIMASSNNKKDLMASALTPTKGILPEIIGSEYSLADIAPTILEILGIAKPIEMTGKSMLGKLK